MRGLFTLFRTDLALECHELLPKEKISGIETKFFRKSSAAVTKIRVTNKHGAERIGKPEGTYITVEIPPLSKYCDSESELTEIIGSQLRLLLPESGTVLVAGLGNESITPDALGPVSCSMILATRHISGEFAEITGLGTLRPTAVFVPGVLGQTGVETAEIIRSLVESVKPCAVIVIDALAARRLSRLGRTVQMSDTGIIPGSGVGNRRSAVNRETLGVPVISVGVPTVVDAFTLANELSDTEIAENDESRSMIITPREIDVVISRAARLVALAVNQALQPHISADEMLTLVTSV